MGELTITLTIADRPYKLKIEESEEEIVRQSAKLINKKISEYSQAYFYKDKQDLLAMVALDFSSNKLEIEKSKQESESKVLQIINEIDSSVTDCLKEASSSLAV
ncbi:MAG: cell division protein ZapA [Bacteroidales bacterium]|jgi:cell division protein ZapA